MKLRKYTTENDNGTDVDVYAVCEDDGAVICLEHQIDFSYITERVSYDESLKRLGASRMKTELVAEVGQCENKYILVARIHHALNVATDEILI